MTARLLVLDNLFLRVLPANAGDELAVDLNGDDSAKMTMYVYADRETAGDVPTTDWKLAA